MTELDLPPKSLIELSRLYDEDPQQIADKKTQFFAWVRRVRVGGGGSIIFLDLYDGTKVGALNCLAAEEEYLPDAPDPNGTELSQDEQNFKTLTFEQLSQAEKLSIGCAVVVNGKVVLSPPNATQDFEFQVTRVQLIGGVEDPLKYPIQKGTEKSMTSLRQLPFFSFPLPSHAMSVSHSFQAQPWSPPLYGLGRCTADRSQHFDSQ
jgi:aspartyl/asparaginyl-tRNA synthetase